MSNYTKQINWAGKDSLADSDPSKVISGNDFDTEFTAVQTAVNSKANLNGSASEAFNATTAAAGTNTTQVATTAFVGTAVSNATTTAAEVNGHAYPVGSIYTSVSSTNPATLLGVGTWEQFAAGRALVGVDTGQTEFDTVEETGGAKTHSLSSSDMPSHTHTETRVTHTNISVDDAGVNPSSTVSYITGSSDHTSGASGSGAAHNNLQPYITVYFWKRTA